METQNIINELKTLGLDPANIDITRLNEDRIKTLLDALSACNADPLASEYLMAMNDAFNRADAPRFMPDFDEVN